MKNKEYIHEGMPYRGLAILFKQRPSKLNPSWCARSTSLMTAMRVVAIVVITSAVVGAAGASVLSVNHGFSEGRLAFLSLMVLLALVAVYGLRLEIGSHVEDVGRGWSRLLRELKPHNLQLAHLDTPKEVIECLDKKMKELTNEVKDCEGRGKKRARARVRRRLVSLRSTIHYSLDVNVSIVDDFFAGHGAVWPQGEKKTTTIVLCPSAH